MNKRLAILAELPRLRRYSRALLRNSTLAEDLVHDCVAQAFRRWIRFATART